jgi:hypothetical protein
MLPIINCCAVDFRNRLRTFIVEDSSRRLFYDLTLERPFLPTYYHHVN